MKKIYLLLLITSLLFIVSCEKFNEIQPETEIQNFVWKGLNAYYLWYDDVDDLQDSRFNSQKELTAFVETQNPTDLFYSLLHDRGNIDKWSWIVEDYVALEQLFAGVTKNNGMEIGVKKVTATSNQVFAYVKYVIPNSNAAANNIQRGDIIYGINNTPLNENNYYDLLTSTNAYDVNFGTYSFLNSIPQVVSNGITITLNKEVLQENPIHTLTINEVDGHQIGYLFYNQFVSNYDTQLNDAFATLKANNISDLVLDLRYNGGGSIRTAIQLASMITGQFNGELFTSERWNSKWQNYFENESPERLINNFTDKLKTGEIINSLNLQKIYILTSERTASASELIINGLLPYIDVVLVGTKTTGKYVGSVTLYDSNNFRKSDASLNPNHHYAMQPLVLELVNKLGENDIDGFDPNYELAENYVNLGVLGNIDEPLFAKAIESITGVIPRNNENHNTISNDELFYTKATIPFYNNMYVDF